jgi:hypothetical protein
MILLLDTEFNFKFQMSTKYVPKPGAFHPMANEV